MDWTDWASAAGGAAGLIGGIVSIASVVDARKSRRLAEAEVARNTEGAAIRLRATAAPDRTAAIRVLNLGWDVAHDVRLTVEGPILGGARWVADRIEPTDYIGVLVHFPAEWLSTSRGLQPVRRVAVTVHFKTPAGAPMEHRDDDVLVYVHREHLGF